MGREKKENEEEDLMLEDNKLKRKNRKSHDNKLEAGFWVHCQV